MDTKKKIVNVFLSTYYTYSKFDALNYLSLLTIVLLPTPGTEFPETFFCPTTSFLKINNCLHPLNSLGRFFSLCLFYHLFFQSGEVEGRRMGGRGEEKLKQFHCSLVHQRCNNYLFLFPRVCVAIWMKGTHDSLFPTGNYNNWVYLASFTIINEVFKIKVSFEVYFRISPYHSHAKTVNIWKKGK